MSNPPARIHFERQSDGLNYVFELKSLQPLGDYKREDADIWLIKDPELGWIVTGDDRKDVLGIPWAFPPNSQGDLPPEGEWVSKKNMKSYVYQLRYEE